MDQYKKAIKRQNFIKGLRARGASFQKIGKMMKISYQRTGEIYSKVYYKPHKESCRICKNAFFKLTPRKRLCDNCSIVSGKLSGRERTREMVRIRDNHACQKCGLKWDENMRRFDVHHLNGNCGKLSHAYDRVKDMAGLITLCHRCHLNLHTVRNKMKNGRRLTDEKKKKINSMRGISAYKIAKTVNLSYPVVYSYLNE